MGTLAGASGTGDFCGALFEATADGCCYAQRLNPGEEPPDWSILAANAAFEQLSGLKQLAGRKISEVMPWLRESAPELQAAFRRVADGGPPESLEPFAGPSGTWGPAEVLSPGPGQVVARFRALPAGQPGEGTLLQQESFIRSILDLQEQLHRTQNLESLGLLAGGIAHDINNVLGAILAVATLHQRKAEAGSPLRRDMETIAQACLRGGALAKSLLGFASTGLHEPGSLALNDLVRDEVRRLERGLGPGLQVREDLSSDLRTMKGDPVALRHAITSLSLNAMEAMSQGGALSFRTRNDGADALLLEVEDTGTGMTPEVLRQALKPFYTTKQATTGAGLGLSIVYGTVRAHRGTLDLQSEPGRGTLVRLRFPASGLQGEEAEG